MVDILYPPSVPLIFRSARFRMEVSNDKGGVHVTLVSTKESSGLQSLYDTAGVRPYSTLGSGHYLAGRLPLPDDSEGVVIHHSSSDAVNEGNEKWRTLDCAVEHGLDTCSLICPYSGRFAYTCQYGHEDGWNRIHVVDLLDL